MSPAGLGGLVELHLHGAFGVDVLTAGEADLDRLALGLESRGVAGFVPTLVPVPLADLAAWAAARFPLPGRQASS